MEYYKQPYDYHNVNSNKKNFTEQRNHRIKVNSIGSVVVKPDKAIISLGVIVEREKAENAQKQNAIIANQIIAALESIGIPTDAISSSGYNIQPIYDYPDRIAVLKAYRVRHMFEVIVSDISKVGEVIDVATQSGANSITNVQFILSEKESYYQEALKQATLHAREKAELIASTLGGLLDPMPLWINEKKQVQQPIITRETLSVATTILERDVVVTAETTAVFQYNGI